MQNRISAWLGGTILCAAWATAAAQIPAETFARRAELHSVSLAPDGRHLALAVPVNDGTETQLQVLSLDGSGETQVLRFGKMQHVSDIVWSADDQLVVSRAKLRPFVEQPVSYGELMSSGIDGSNQSVLFAYLPDKGNTRGRRKDTGFASVVKVLDQEPGQVLVRFECWRTVCGDEPPTVIFKVDTVHGGRTEVERMEEPAWFDFDRSGRARIATTYDDAGNPVLRYRPGAGNEWQPMPKALAGRSIGTTWFAPDNNTVYAVVSDRGEPGQLYKLDLAAGTRTKLAGRDDVGISHLMYAGFEGEPFAVVYDADKPSIQYLDPQSEWAQMHLGLLRSFPGQMLSLRGASRDNGKLLLSTWSDRDPGAWYVFDRNERKLQKVAGYQPWIDPAQMTPTRPISFQARDGTTLYGFLTSRGQGPRPLVVMPHGGPFGVYDRWTYDPDVQFLASRGYAVLQVNFRGSGGRGELSMQSGWKEWGGKIQDDIADGVRWAIAQNLVDPQRICVFGASFGGYSALMQPIRYPDLYKCAIGYAGVYDLNLMRKTDSFSITEGGKRFFDRTLGTDPAMLAEISPSNHVDQLRVPVLLVHGKNDKVADFDQFQAMERALRDAGRTPETLVVASEGHGFINPQNRTTLYERIEAFLDEHIGD